MLFNSYEFLFFFLPVTLAVFHLIGTRVHHRVAIAWLVAASLFFYGWWNPVYLTLIVASILFNYGVGAMLASHANGLSGKQRKRVLIGGLAANLVALGYFKYANFFVDTAAYLSGTGWRIDDIVLPLAISFFTFQQITYLVDAYRGETREYNFLHYCLFVTFFPQLIAGPIVHHREMLPQFARDAVYRLKATHLAVGGTIFFIGLFKKVVIADRMALAATPVFAAADAGQAMDFLTVWRGVGAYTMQLYFDFSGYSDMAIGLARMFGVRLPLNFNSPYRAVSITDFWRRWHMTLSRFLRDYVYLPLGGNRHGNVRRFTNLMIVMLLGGLWHGAGWTFVFWGGLHGLYLVVNHAWRAVWKKPVNRWWSTALGRLVTLFFVMIGWVFFRAETFDGALNLLHGMTVLPAPLEGLLGPLSAALSAIGFSFSGPDIQWADAHLLGWATLWLAVVWWVPNTQEFMARFGPALEHVKHAPRPAPLQRLFTGMYWRPAGRWAVWVGGLAGLALLSLSQVSEFLYFQF